MEPFKHLLRAPGYKQPNLKTTDSDSDDNGLNCSKSNQGCSPAKRTTCWPWEGCRHKEYIPTGLLRSPCMLDFARKKHCVVSLTLGA